MRILLTGATGFLGRHIINKLRTKDCEIVALVRPSSDIEELKQNGLEFIYGDLRDEQCIAEAVKNVDVVIHSAATMRGNWDDYYNTNVKSTEILLENCRIANIKRFIFISSVINYDHSSAKPGTEFTEEMPYENNNLTNYSRSKIEAEKVVLKYHKEYGIPSVVLRPAALYGLGGPIYPARLGFALGSKTYIVIGDGKQEIPLSHVKSVADAAWGCINKGISTGKCYNVIEDGKITQNEFLKRVKELANSKLIVFKLPYNVAKFLSIVIQKGLGLVGKSSPIRLPYLKLCSTQYYYSNQKAKDELAWQPQRNFESSINNMLNQFAEQRKPRRMIPIHRGKVIIPTDSKLNVGMVGCGLFAETHLSILRKFENANIIALCDPDDEARKKLANRFNISRTYSDLENMLAKEKIDVIHIVTPAQTHHDLTITAMKNNCHVLVEKPMAINAKEAREMIRLAKKNNVKLCVDHNHLFDEVIIKAREILAKGSIGRISYVESWYATSYSSNTNNRYLKYDARNHWVYRLPGSLYQNMISHPICLLTDIMGEVKDLKASTKYMHIVPHMQNDELRVLVEGENMIGSIHMSLAISPRYHLVNIYATHGTLRIDFLNKYIFFDKVVPFVPKVMSRNLMTLKHAMNLFYATVRNGVNVIRGKYSLFEGNERLIHLFYRSVLLDEPEPVSPEEALQSMEIMDEIWNQINKKQSNSHHDHYIADDNFLKNIDPKVSAMEV